MIKEWLLNGKAEMFNDLTESGRPKISEVLLSLTAAKLLKSFLRLQAR
jgi:hypothetical protein